MEPIGDFLGDQGALPPKVVVGDQAAKDFVLNGLGYVFWRTINHWNSLDILCRFDIILQK
jgi:hypothetical protein